MALAAAVALAAYLVGTFPTAALAARGHDVTREGSGNPGASNVYRLAGRRAGITVFLGDALKGALATAAGYATGGRDLALVAGAAAVVGHCFPVFRRFRGGKGVATAAGLAIVVEPAIALGALVLWLVVARVGHKASVASLAIALAAPVAVAVWRGPHLEAAVVAGVALLVIGRHAGNLSRLMRGEERTIQ
jgi:glycerol-3-phosphate acyltransferase PlsY